ncbi:DNA replication protein DnaC [Flavonifractor sp. An92]|uniref:ATP-binding protein n=1 Tax=Flavonifractor sp. An92 TaxID=1965666 RepID=UPI000B3AE38B|nr:MULTISPECIES: ATP-binding protein [unclassified Flavonifractor]OUN04217.1 DNA replication protein DnaC [Flavonifractor sp. An92]OUQ21644.1 DNA replication protein DnaC [Flavonifractor sp. An135]
MAYDPNVLRRATQRLAQRRRQREEEWERRRAEIYAALPQAARLEGELRSTMAGVIAASLRHGTDPAPAIAQLKEKNLELQRQRTQLLTDAGYPPDALDERPYCPRCGDSGWVGARMCSCLHQLCTEEQIQELSKLLDLGEQSFETFNLDYYSPLPPEGGGKSPRERMKSIFQICRLYANTFPEFRYENLFLTGAPGLGKTFLSACIARTVSERGYSVVYDTAVNIFTRFEERKFARDRQDAEDARDETRRYLRCDLLILDDLGSEMATPFVQSALYTLINTRLTARRHTVISSNLSMGEIYRRYSPQIASRLEGEYQVLLFQGEDIRLLRKQER